MTTLQMVLYSLAMLAIGASFGAAVMAFFIGGADE